MLYVSKLEHFVPNFQYTKSILLLLLLVFLSFSFHFDCCLQWTISAGTKHIYVGIATLVHVMSVLDLVILLLFGGAIASVSYAAMDNWWSVNTIHLRFAFAYSFAGLLYLLIWSFMLLRTTHNQQQLKETKTKHKNLNTHTPESEQKITSSSLYTNVEHM